MSDEIYVNEIEFERLKQFGLFLIDNQEKEIILYGSFRISKQNLISKEELIERGKVSAINSAN